ncbi:MAG: FtsQ-type POTRA domain-containing protein [Clostridiales bacterium]|nr:FtsQ-type POTRA domain-containing protein [Clostridiales bacterium]
MVGLLIIFLFGYGGYALANSSFFDITEIRIQGNGTVSRDEIIAMSGLRYGANSLKYHLGQVRANILSQPYVKTAEVSRVLPNRVDIRVSERTPAALIRTEDKFWVLDESGYCLVEAGLITAQSRALPNIRCSEEAAKLAPGERSQDKGVLAALALIKRLDPFFMESILEFEASSAERLAVICMDGLPVYFGQPEDLDRKLQNYEELLIKNAEQCNGETLEYVDLRYDTQITLKKKQ